MRVRQQNSIPGSRSRAAGNGVFIRSLQLKNSLSQAVKIFIEPKNKTLSDAEKWKKDFLLKLSGNAKPLQHYDDKKFKIVGLPFFTKEEQGKFIDAMGEFVD